MGLYRTLYATLPCGRCEQGHRTGIQFRTGHDNLEEYEEGQVLPASCGLTPGIPYPGIADWYCKACLLQRKAIEAEAFFEALTAFITEDRLVIKTGFWLKRTLPPAGVSRLQEKWNMEAATSTLFSILEGLALSWDNNPAPQGGPAHTNFIVSMNDRITATLQQKGWNKPTLLREDLSIFLDAGNALQVVIEASSR